MNHPERRKSERSQRHRFSRQLWKLVHSPESQTTVGRRRLLLLRWRVLFSLPAACCLLDCALSSWPSIYFAASGFCVARFLLTRETLFRVRTTPFAIMDLVCIESPQLGQVLRAPFDATIVGDSTVMARLLDLQTCYTVTCDYCRNVQSEVERPMRKILALWMSEVRPLDANCLSGETMQATGFAPSVSNVYFIECSTFRTLFWRIHWRR